MGRDAFIRAGVITIGAAIGLSLSSAPAAACNKTNGCTMDVLLEEDQMMRDGRMTQAMQEGQANMEAFRRQREAEQAVGTRASLHK